MDQPRRVRFRVLLLVALLGVAFLPALATAATASATILYFAPGHVPQPLDLVGFNVGVEPVHFRDAQGQAVTGTLYLPQVWGRHSALVLVHGWTELAEQDPEAVRFGHALARTGHAVLVPRLERLRSGYVDETAIDALIGAVSFLRGRADINADRIGLFGVCLGADIAITAAADPRMPPLRLVAGVNAYYDLVDVLQGVTTSTSYVGGQLVQWAPYPPVGALVQRNMSRVAQADPETAALAKRMLENRDPDRVRPLFAALPEAARRELMIASPASSIDRVKTRLVLLQAAADPVVPPGSLGQFERALGTSRLVSFGSSNPLLRHNDLRPPPLDWTSLRQVYLPGSAQLLGWGFAVFSTLDG